MSQCVIIGGGSSINVGRELDLWEKIKEEDTYAVNFAWLAMPYLPKHQLWLDTGFFRNDIQRIEKLYKDGVECITKPHAKYNAIPEIIKYKTKKDINDSVEGLYVGTSGLSGTFALAVAVDRKYDTIYLLGFDYGTKSLNDTNTHFYQNDKIQFTSRGVRNPKVYLERSNTPKKSVKNYDYFNQFPCKIYNVSPQSNIASFEKIDYPTFFQHLIKNT